MTTDGCEYYALCRNQTDRYSNHPIIGQVPTCARCASRHGITTYPSAAEDGIPIARVQPGTRFRYAGVDTTALRLPESFTDGFSRERFRVWCRRGAPALTVG